METLAGLFPEDGDHLAQRLARIAAGDAAARDALLADLVDRHGTGRVMVRNRRAAVGGFPTRIPHLATLPAPEDPTVLGTLRAEFAHDVGDTDDEPAHDYARDPRTDYKHLLHELELYDPALLKKPRLVVANIADDDKVRAALREHGVVRIYDIFFDYDVLIAGPVVPQMTSLFDEYWNAPQVRTLGSVQRPADPPELLRQAFDACRRAGAFLILDETYRDFLPGEGRPLHRFGAQVIQRLHAPLPRRPVQHVQVPFVDVARDEQIDRLGLADLGGAIG